MDPVTQPASEKNAIQDSARQQPADRGSASEKNAAPSTTAPGPASKAPARQGSADPADLAPDAPAFSVHDLCAWYGDRQVLRNVSLEARPGRVTALIGPSGCGKSTLLACLDRTLELNGKGRCTGSVRLGPHDLLALPADQARALVGLVTQTPRPFPFSVLKNLAYVPRYRGVRSRARLEAIAQDAARQVGLYDELEGDLKRSALALSGGQQQRLCIARALTAEPAALLLDEPCSSLDVASTAEVERVILDLKQRCPVVLVTHNLAQARRVADDVVCLLAGHVTWAGPASQLFAEDGPGPAVLEELYA